MKGSERLLTKVAFVLTLVLLCFSLNCKKQIREQITEEEAKILMDRYMETSKGINLALIDEILDPGYVLHTPAFPEPIVGVKGYKSFVMNTANTFSDFNCTLDELIVKGDRIWSRFTITGTNTGPLGQIPATGKKFKVSGLAVTRIANGKIAGDETFWNVLDLYQQLGFTLIPPHEKNKQ
jgi:steroid delta-isomerase-like uncharacterized protein